MTKDELFLEYKNLLFSIAYDMLGNVAEAEDLVQETYIKWVGAGVPINYPKAYLVRTITNLSINYLDLARKKREQYVGVWLPSPIIERAGTTSQPGEIYHALSIGLMVLLEKLTPLERAVFLLKEIFSYDHREIGEMIDKTEDNCRQLLTRAKKQLGNTQKRFQIDLHAHEEILKRFLEACSTGDINNLVGMLKDDIVLYADGGGNVLEINNQRLSAAPLPINGKENVSKFIIGITNRFLAAVPDANQKTVIINGVPGVINCAGDKPLSIISVEIDDGKISRIYGHSNPEKVRSSGAFEAITEIKE